MQSANRRRQSATRESNLRSIKGIKRGSCLKSFKHARRMAISAVFFRNILYSFFKFLFMFYIWALKLNISTCMNVFRLTDTTPTPTPFSIKRWLSIYMADRQSYVEYRSAHLRLRINKQGVPQGDVLSPLLFNYYVSKLPSPAPSVTIISYADDCTVTSTGRYI